MHLVSDCGRSIVQYCTFKKGSITNVSDLAIGEGIHLNCHNDIKHLGNLSARLKSRCWLVLLCFPSPLLMMQAGIGGMTPTAIKLGWGGEQVQVVRQHFLGSPESDMVIFTLS